MKDSSVCRKLQLDSTLTLMKFNVNVKHVPGKQLVIADVLRRSPIPHDDRVMQQAQEVELHVHSIQGRCFVSMNRQSKYKFETSAAQDSSLKQIARFILHGWPKQTATHLQANEKRER